MPVQCPHWNALAFLNSSVCFSHGSWKKYRGPENYSTSPREENGPCRDGLSWDWGNFGREPRWSWERTYTPQSFLMVREKQAGMICHVSANLGGWQLRWGKVGTNFTSSVWQRFVVWDHLLILPMHERSIRQTRKGPQCPPRINLCSQLRKPSDSTLWNASLTKMSLTTDLPHNRKNPVQGDICRDW